MVLKWNYICHFHFKTEFNIGEKSLAFQIQPGSFGHFNGPTKNILAVNNSNLIEEKFRPHYFKYTWISREYSAVFWALPNRLRASQISFKKRREFSTIYNAGIVTYIRSTFAYYFFHIQISVGYFSRNLQIWIPLENI